MLKYAQNPERFPQMVKSFFFYAQRKGAAAPVDYLSTFATAPFINFAVDFYLSRSARTLRTSPVNPNRAMAFGITIKLLNKSDNAQTKSFPPTVPRKMNTKATIMKGFTAFSPNNH